MSLEAVMPKGTVKHVRPDQNFGFITPEDGSAGVHFNLRGVPEPLLVEGAEVEYTLGKSKPGQSPHADKVWGSTDSAANAPPAATTSPPTKKSVTPSQNIAVGFVIGEPLSWVTTEGRQKKEWVRLPVWVVVTKLGNPVVSEEVKLDAEGVPVVQGIEKAYTLSD
jgi:cold shock CspA family protein